MSRVDVNSAHAAWQRDPRTIEPGPDTGDWDGRVALVSTVALLALALVVGLGWTASLDTSIYRATLLADGSAGETFAASIIRLGDVWVALAVGLLGLLIAALRRSPQWLILLAPLATLPIELLAKNTIPRTLGHDTTAVQLGSLLTIAAPYTFPSGNTARVAAVVVALALLATRTGLAPDRRRATEIAVLAGVCIVALAAWSHLAVGDHWPSDVLGGLFLGAAATFGFAWLVTAMADRRGAGRRG